MATTVLKGVSQLTAMENECVVSLYTAARVLESKVW